MHWRFGGDEDAFRAKNGFGDKEAGQYAIWGGVPIRVQDVEGIVALVANAISGRTRYPNLLTCSVDDFGPGNVLVDDSLHVTGVIEWVFCYTAPMQFTGSIPSWLLLQRPHRIINELGAAGFLDMFLPRAEVFLNCLEQKEGATGGAKPEDRLSARMRKSIEDKSAWFILASRMVSSVDMIYWELLDEFCWGPRSSIAERIHNVTTIPEKHEERESFVRLKIRQLQEYYTELSEETTVKYEEKSFTKSEEAFDHGTNCDRLRDAKSSPSDTVAVQDTGSHVSLPLTLPLKSLQNIGTFGNDAPDVTDGLSYQGATTDTPQFGFNIGTLSVGGGSGSARSTCIVSPLQAIRNRTDARLQYITDIEFIARDDFSSIFPPPEVCLVFLKTWASETMDRINFENDYNSTVVVNNVASHCPNTIVVTHSAGVNTMPWALNPNVTAILAAHYPGQESGNAIVDVLFGDVNPSGRLPYTIPITDSDYDIPVVNITGPAAYDSSAWQSDFTEGLMIDYRHFDIGNITPLYEFGFGLSYTTFNNSKPISVRPLKGWGDGFLSTLVNGSIGTNFAHSGATTASFVADGYWAKVLDAVKENKSLYHPYVTVQFGHNDQKSTSGVSIAQFTANLEKMVADVRSAGGSPILVTSLSRRSFDSSGHVIPSLANVVAATKAAAKATNCEYVDLNKASTDYLNSIGAEKAATYNLSPTDYTHLNNHGMILFGNMMGWLLQTTIADSSKIAPYIHPRSDVVAAIEAGNYIYPS
ncbi:hypothetical protein CNMCM7691_002367 [Aspergillus felis]|uniref:beta-glucosidase n=1 Tax=Aspergillus felis TaxID=1287682 RepID=A0A8H6R3A4_9EURO|nr:hypothetical protein CNMCM7691_002367 [Aspergillus felis]